MITSMFYYLLKAGEESSHDDHLLCVRQALAWCFHTCPLIQMLCQRNCHSERLMLKIPNTITRLTCVPLTKSRASFRCVPPAVPQDSLRQRHFSGMGFRGRTDGKRRSQALDPAFCDPRAAPPAYRHPQSLHSSSACSFGMTAPNLGRVSRGPFDLGWCPLRIYAGAFAHLCALGSEWGQGHVSPSLLRGKERLETVLSLTAVPSHPRPRKLLLRASSCVHPPPPTGRQDSNRSLLLLGSFF